MGTLFFLFGLKLIIHDARSIEDLVYKRCPDIVANCVVVGNGRPQPALFVEVHERVVFPDVAPTGATARGIIPTWWHTEQAQRRVDELKKEIVNRIREDMELR